ncbi:MAG TPA: GNAT family N-acetyltransferase [Terriglobales bacterium]|nr:GNAT family N-acetyltransferase [Terriglobales bacterium]
MFVDLTVAARIDRAEASLCAGIVHAHPQKAQAAGLVLPIAGGQAVYDSPASPVNKVIGLGFNGPLVITELEAVESAWRERNEPVRVELCSLVAPEFAQTLSARGYHLQGFEDALGRTLNALPSHETSAGIRVAPVANDADFRSWKEISVTAFTSMDGTGSVVDDPLEREQMENILTNMTSAPGFRRYLAWLDGRAVGAASFRIEAHLAQMCGAGTLPVARGKGIQKALLNTRLVDAHAAGCDLAVVTTAPGSRSEENMVRRGFSLLYCRAVMIKTWE